MFKKGYTPWNKGKTGLTQLSTIGFSGRKHSQEAKDKIRDGKLGDRNPMYGKGYLREGELNPMYGRPASEKARKVLLDNAIGEKNVNWKGDDVGYRSLHSWIERNLGRPDKCENCIKSGLKGHAIHWASKSHEYKRETSNWIRLCPKCHGEYDKQNKLRLHHTVFKG